jgi:phenylpropionate dioxygenase-like ring-hydroxylating dioxygenase large terminal subunit
MRSRMHPRYYLCSEVFSQEQQKIFRKTWQFAGLKTLLPQNNSFITRKIAGLPIVIQNFHGELHAFENVCLHRSAALQKDAVGCRPLICPYHAWKYNATGQVSNIPHCDAIYRFDESQKQSLKLREFALRIVGNLIFINLDPQPYPLEEQFSADFIESLESSSNSYDNEVMVTTWNCKFNWKLPYENLRDANHVAYVHPRSLAPFVSFAIDVDSTAAKESEQPLSNTSPEGLRQEMRGFSLGGKPEGIIEKLSRFEWHGNVDRWRASARSKADPRTDDAYFNWLVYPNTHIASGDGGHTFTIEHHIPIAPHRTDVEIYYLTARKKNSYATSAQVLLAAMHAGHRILTEDYDILEQLQSTLHMDAPVPTQGAYESTNQQIERWYTTLMEDSHEL